jgi:HAD superfamily hydrolase (TIGR01662 family)
MIRAVLFDLGDTLLDYVPVPRSVLFEGAARKTYEYLQQQGIKLPGFGRYYTTHIWAVRWAYIWATLRGREVDSFIAMQRFCRRQGYPSDEAFVDGLLWMWYQPIIPQSSVQPEVIPALRQLREAGVSMAIVSNTLLPGRILDRHLELVGLMEFFPVRVYSSEVTYRKPNRIIFDAALKEIAVPAEECLFVGDLVKTDVVGAKRVGMKTVLRRTPRRQNYAAADYVIDGMAELPGLVLSHQGLAKAG